VSPNGRRLATFEDEFGFCVVDDLGYERHATLALRDLDSDQVFSIVGRDGWEIGKLVWSPAGDELLVELVQLPEPRGGCTQRFQKLDDVAVEWLLIDAESDVTILVDDPDAVKASWRGDPRPLILCRGVEANVGAVRSYRCSGQHNLAIDADLFYDGEYVGSGDQLWVLGVIEVGAE
jgi:hypothetical protein